MKYTKTVLMLTLTALISGNVSAMDRAQDALGTVENTAKQLLRDIKEYKKCRNTEEGCSPELIQRLRNAGLKITAGIGAAIVIAAGAVAGRYGIRKLQARKWQGKWGDVYENLKAKFNFEYSSDNDELLRNAWKGSDSALNYVQNADKEAVKAAVFIANQRGHTNISKAIQDAWLVRVKKPSYQPLT